MKKFLDLNVPFFVPMWRRVLTVAVLGAWTAVEIAANAPVWAIIFGAATAWCVYSFFIAWEDPE